MTCVLNGTVVAQGIAHVVSVSVGGATESQQDGFSISARWLHQVLKKTLNQNPPPCIQHSGW